ncbi:hypothetical protein K210_04815 [Erysipelothrix rhusiopathiae SY1027]|uniref:hypothetical protein n=1 Tax=Erysipelothrix rhusiopathiae TaxID=1648 RepID=UPI0003348D5C|nr:hypothetical protein [Erysipelothrix rhusiopathiae]AGN24566.1 hypothetical protein K210_04815 [Erysipelothrix rhusiopathiae SY1027]
MESFIEIFEDFMFLNGVLQFKKSLSNLQSKELFSEVLMIMNPIVVYEFTKYLDDNQMIESSSFFKTQQASYFVRNLRNKSLKIKPSKSSQASNAIKKMGISFEDDIYDLTITIDQNQALHNMNFEQNVLDFDTNIETYESLIHIIQDTLKIIFSILELNYKEIFENENLTIFNDSEARLFEKKLSIRKTIVTLQNLFFSNIKGSKLTKKDKNFILFNYRSIHSCTIFTTKY